MSSTTIATALKNYLGYIYNPEALSDVALDCLIDMSDPDASIELADPSDPVVATLEHCALMTYAAVCHDWWCMTKTYPRLAQSMDDLYRHMSDKDYDDIFHQPADTYGLLVLNKEEIFKYAVPPDGANIRRLIIPRDSSYTVDGYTFTLQYPIEIRVLPSGGLRIVQLSDTASPIRTLDTNAIDWQFRTITVDNVGYEVVAIKMPVMQYKVSTISSPIVAGMSFKETISYNDKFFTARVWMQQKSGTWVELKKTFSQIAIDPTDPTAVVTLQDSKITVSIPDIYIRSGLVSGTIRIDTYVTKGAMRADFTSHTSNSFELALADLNSEIPSIYTAPFSKLSFIRVYSPTTVDGGRNALTFDELRTRVINNSVGAKVLPISDSQLTEALEDLGYTKDLSIELQGTRIYHATRELLQSTISEVSTPCGTTNGVVRTSFDDLIKLPTVYNNGNRITIGPKTLYEDVSNTYQVHKLSIDQLSAWPIDDRVDYINNNRLFFTPFYYVLDTNSEIFEARPYDLDSPTITSKEFVTTNIALELDITIGECTLTRHADGYVLRIITSTSDAVKKLNDSQVEAQLCFKSRSSDDWARINGVLVGYYENERVYDFLLATTMDLDKNHDIIITNALVNGNTVADQAMVLSTELNIVFGVNQYTTPNYQPSSIDSVLVGTTKTSKGVTHEILRVTLGHYLANLWANARDETGGASYLTYPADVVAKYDKVVYKKVNGVYVTELDGDGKKRLVVEHQIGDIRYEADGVTPVIQHKAGSVVYDNGVPVVENHRKLIRRLELYLLDARYALCTDPSVVEYLTALKTDLLTAVLVDLAAIKSRLLPETDIYLYPRNNMGKVWVRYSDNTKNQIAAELNFIFTMYVTETVRKDSVLIAKITKTMRSVIGTMLEDSTVTVSKILEAIRAKISDYIVDIEMEGFGDAKDQKVYTLVNAKDKLTVAKTAYVTSDGYVSLKDDIRVGWGRLDEDLK